MAGVFVHVFRHPDEKPLLGFLPMFLFAPGHFPLHALCGSRGSWQSHKPEPSLWSGFDRIAVRGLRIEVQKKGLALMAEMPAVYCPAAWRGGISVVLSLNPRLRS